MSENIQEYAKRVCHSYEQGYTSGDLGYPAYSNIYSIGSPEYYAWHYGHNNALTDQLLNGDLDIIQEWEL